MIFGVQVNIFEILDVESSKNLFRSALLFGTLTITQAVIQHCAAANYQPAYVEIREQICRLTADPIVANRLLHTLRSLQG